MNFKELLGKQMLFFDGATGTQLQARGLQPGELPESWNFIHPDIVEAVHRSYLDVGSNIVKSNTFGANPLKLAGSGLDCKETIEAAVAIAKKACGGRENKFVALNLGPTGKLLAPYGDLPFEKAVEAYGEMVRYGAAAGADLILIETMSDTYEIKAAVLASKENCDLPICVTMTFDEDGKLLTGATVEAAALMCEGLGVDAIGFNCGLGPVQVGKLFPQMLVLAEAATADVVPQGLGDVMHTLLANIVSNPVASIMNGNYIGILMWACLFGLAMKRLGSDTTKNFMVNTADAVSTIVRWIINLAPFGIMGLVFANVSDNGLSIFTQYGRLLLLLVGTMLLMALVINPLIIFIYLHRNPYPLVLRCLRESGLTAFFTRSSAANIPVNMSLCEKLGLDKDIYSVSIPLGATINMDGAAITITIMTLAATNTLGMEVSLPAAILLSIMSALGACGASGVAGGSLLLIPMACSLFGISNDIAMQVVGVGFIIGVIQDSVETALNSAGDVEFAATAEYHQWLKEGKPLPDFMA